MSPSTTASVADVTEMELFDGDDVATASRSSGPAVTWPHLWSLDSSHPLRDHLVWHPFTVDDGGVMFHGFDHG